MITPELIAAALGGSGMTVLLRMLIIRLVPSTMGERDRIEQLRDKLRQELLQEIQRLEQKLGEFEELLDTQRDVNSQLIKQNTQLIQQNQELLVELDRRDPRGHGQATPIRA